MGLPPVKPTPSRCWRSLQSQVSWCWQLQPWSRTKLFPRQWAFSGRCWLGSPVRLASPRSTLPSPAGTPPRWHPSQQSSVRPSPSGSPFLPGGLQPRCSSLGLRLAFVGIWLVSRSAPVEGQKANSRLGLAFLAGAGFGGYFIFIGLVEGSGVFLPLLFARGIMFLGALLLLAVKRLPLPSIRENPVAPLAGVLDAAGNVFFLIGNHPFPA